MVFPRAYLTEFYLQLWDQTHYNVLDTDSKAIASLVQVLVYISYPLIGLLADVKLTHYRMICLSCWVIFIYNLLRSFSFAMHYDELYLHSPLTTTIFIGSVVFYASGILGKGMFESTVIQFCTDQMIEASVISPTQHIHTLVLLELYVGNVCVDVISAVIISMFSQCKLRIFLMEHIVLF